MTSFSIRAEGLAKQYRLGQIERYNTLRDVLTNSFAAPFRALRRSDDPSARVNGRGRERIWALRDVSFEIAPGEIVGLVGANGAGKTTLLKILSKITEPTAGKAWVAGRVGSLLEVGTGFHPELTGRDNVFLNGIILGMRKREIERKFDEIVDFAGVERFIDTPVKRYSSGMQVRLAFSVAAFLEPEVLLVDEVLAVGDAQFQRKSLGRMEDVTHDGRTVVFVSHNMTAIRKLCPRTILIEGGRAVMDGPTEAVLSHYLESIVDEVGTGIVDGEALRQRANQHLWHDQPVFEGREVALLDSSGAAQQSFASDQEVTVSIGYDVFETVTNLQVIVELRTEEGETLLRSELLDDPVADERYISRPGRYTALCHIPANLFGERRFYLTVHLICQNVQHLAYERVVHFDVTFMGHNDNLSVHSRQGYFRPRLVWELELTDTPRAQ